ncbi:MAG TPA: hypothetical protein VKF82_00725 [Candidatus Eremiobacteraceae bacterium]|nr:hypothetical protein [Candidatus Eremiobacteraceae bacterium]
MKRLCLLAGLAALASAGCSAASVNPPPPAAAHNVYVSNFANSGSQIAIVGLPATVSSVPTIVAPAGLHAVTALAFDGSGNLWAVNDFSTAAVNGYSLPLSNASTPFATINIPGAKNPVALAFDSSGNLWVADGGTNLVLKFTPPFSGSVTPAPAVVISSVTAPSGLAFDSAGNLYVSKGILGLGAIEIFNPPFSTGQLPTAAPLTGSSQPGALVFDAAGNLYTLNTNGNIDRFTAPTAGGGPISVEQTGSNTLITNAGALAFDSNGNLYATNIQSPQLYLFSNAAATFSGNMPVPMLLTLTGFGVNGTGGVAIH